MAEARPKPTPQPSTDLVAPDPQQFAGVLATQQSRAVFLPATLAEAMQLAHFMAGGIGVRQWMRGNPSACLALIQISMRWGMDPYIVANKAYYTSDTLSFESQLVNAVINTSGLLIGRLKVEFSGDAKGKQGEETLNCRVSGRLAADPDQVFVHEQPLQSIKIRNSPLWTVNPRQQLQYHATRAWARLYMPEVLLGIYTPDEIADGEASRIEAQSTPRDATPAPDRRSFESEAETAEDADFTPIETVLPEEPVETVDSEAVAAGNGLAEVESDESDGLEEVISGKKAAKEPEKPLPAEDPLPVEPLEWSAWKREVLNDLGMVTDQASFNNLRRRIDPALQQADDALAGEIQDAFADKLLTLPEPESKK